jgi:hypothetical protein
MWNEFFTQSSYQAKFLMICHSQGAIHVRNALMDYPEDFRKRIIVIAIAPAAYIDPKTCGDVMHYRAEWWRDPIPRYDIAGAVIARNHITTLSSRSVDPYFNHSFMNQTYEKSLRDNINRYLKNL